MINVAAQSVDFPVMRNIAKRLRHAPRRQSVRAVARMGDTERDGEIGILQIPVKSGQLRSRDQPFVNDCARRQTANIKLGQIPVFKRPDRIFNHASDHIQLADKLRFVCSV